MKMVNFKKSFDELKDAKVWLHYAIGTVGIIAVFWWLMQQGILSENSGPFLYGLIFFVVYVVVDRTSHAVLELF